MNMPLKIQTVNSIKLWALVLAVGLTTFSPAVHYIGYAIALSMILFFDKSTLLRQIKENFSDCSITLPLLALLLYLSISYYITSASLYEWLRTLSIPLEMCLGIFLTVMILDTQDKIDSFVNSTAILLFFSLVAFNLAFILGFRIRNVYMLNNLYGLGWLTYNYMPFILYYSLFSKKSNIYLCIIMLIICGASLISASAVSVWGTAFVEVLLVFFFIHKYQPKNAIKKIMIACLGIIIIAGIINVYYNNYIYNAIADQSRQLLSFNNANAFTTNRNELWTIAVILIKEHPLWGTGFDSLYNLFPSYYLKYKDTFGLTLGIQNTPHSMYIGMAQESGIPSLFLFLFFILSVIYKSIMFARKGVMFKIIPTLYLIGLLVIGISGDHIFYDRRDLAVLCWTALGLGIINIKRQIISDSKTIGSGAIMR